MPQLDLLNAPTHFLFFTGKGGVGKTSVSTACAIALADAGKKVLLVSTDSASNLDQMLGITLSNAAAAVPQVPGMSVLNIDPNAAAQAYRLRVLAQMPADSSTKMLEGVREQMSGPCTTEIAAFDEFAGVLADELQTYDHIVFDTAPTGHTLRLLSLPGAWSSFLAGNTRGASCLGPHSGLQLQEHRFAMAMKNLTDPKKTTIVLVTRPESGAMSEAARTSLELDALHLTHQRLLVNGVFKASVPDDPVATAFEAIGAKTLADLPQALQPLPQDRIHLKPFDTDSVQALRALLSDAPPPETSHVVEPEALRLAPLSALVDQLALNGKGLIMVMGKGGVGKTSIAAALALGLVKRGHAVHLSTTDPAAHLQTTLGVGSNAVANLRVDRIDPVAETHKYIARMLATKGAKLDAAGKALMNEDLQSPCTEEVAVFHAFSRIVSEARSAFVVLDTAPTGHSMLLMDTTGAYHRQIQQELGDNSTAHLVTPLMRLQDPTHTQIILVTLPESTPVTQAAELQEDLVRAGVTPFAWVINKSMAAASVQDPLLRARLVVETKQVKRVTAGLSPRTFVVPWLSVPPVGVATLQTMA